MTLRIGMMGASEGNGHPFSFSAIINGYDPDRLRAAGWDAISSYLDVRDPVDFGFSDAQVTHAWCPDPAETAALCETAAIPHAVTDPAEMIGQVDAVVLARDDWQTHWSLARPFLEAGIAVLVDKPLTLDRDQLEWFRPHLDEGRLMSCSAYRFAPELDALRGRLTGQRRPLVLQGVGPIDWERYAVHLVEPLLTLTAAWPIGVVAVDADHDAAVIGLSDGATLAVHCLGSSAPGFVLNVTTASTRHEIPLLDRYSAFRRLLAHFVRMVKSREPVIDPADTLMIMDVLITGRAGRSSR